MNLRRTARIRTPGHRLISNPLYWRGALRAFRWKLEMLFMSSARCGNGCDNSRDNISLSANDYPITDQEPLSLDLVLIV
jgi:hypothetical protein